VLLIVKSPKRITILAAILRKLFCHNFFDLSLVLGFSNTASIFAHILSASALCWLKRIVVNKSINYLKLKKIPIIPLKDEFDAINDDIIESDYEISDIKKVIKAIGLLPAGFQQIINLYLVEGYDHVEIGEILGIATSTSKSQYHRAKKKVI